MEAEYITLCASIQEAIWLWSLLKEVQYTSFVSTMPTMIYEDNQSCIALAGNSVYYARMEHIDIKYHFIRDHTEKKDIKIVYCSMTDMVADTLMKLLARPAFERHIKALGVGLTE